MATTSPPLSPSLSSPLPPQQQPSLPLPLQSISPPKPKPPPSPWSHLETIHLITAYQHRWYSLNRGQLKASQWHDLSLSLSSICGSVKTATQCRHKIEKLRKRYRAQKTKPNPRDWEYFELMHTLDRGGPIITNPNNLVSLVSSARPIAMIHNPNPRLTEINDYDDDEEVAVNLVESSESEEGEREEGAMLAGEIRRFAERMIKVEEKKMEMMRENQRYMMEMEKRRAEMVQDSHRKVVDIIAMAFGSQNNKKKMKMDRS